MTQTEQWNFRLLSEKAKQVEALRQQLGIETRNDFLNKALDLILQHANLQDIEKISIEGLPKQASKCRYASENIVKKDGIDYSYCDNLNKRNLPKERLIPTEACKNCFERRKQNHSDRKIALKEILQQLRIYTCMQLSSKERENGFFVGSGDGGSFAYLSELPCIKDTLFDCEGYGFSDLETCVFNIHKEWRTLFAKASSH